LARRNAVEAQEWTSRIDTTSSGVLMLDALVSGERSASQALPCGVPGSAMRAYMILRPASQ